MIDKLFRYDFINTLKYTIKYKGRFKVYKFVRMSIDKTAKIIINGDIVIGFKENPKSRQETRLLMEKNSKLMVNEKFQIGFGSDIRIFNGGELILNSGFINGFIQISCAKKIEIRKECSDSKRCYYKRYGWP